MSQPISLIFGEIRKTCFYKNDKDKLIYMVLVLSLKKFVIIFCKSMFYTPLQITAISVVTSKIKHTVYVILSRLHPVQETRTRPSPSYLSKIWKGHLRRMKKLKFPSNKWENGLKVTSHFWDYLTLGNSWKQTTIIRSQN